MVEKQMTVRLSKTLKDRLKAVADAQERSPHYIAKKALEAYVAEQEWHLRNVRIAEERLDKFRKSGVARDPEAVRRKLLEGRRNGVEAAE
ncbi:MAG: ribbon-helix-helix domain-containing protein [Litorimonas sp.]